MNKIDISIIVPIYNAEKYLKKCLDSLVNQTKKELEFILINDGSTDKSEEIVKTYKDERIKYFKNKNQGIGKTRNFGIEKATGKYIMFLDSDDYFSSDACEKLYKTAEKEKADLIVFDYYRVEKENLNEVKIESFNATNIKDDPNLLLKVNLGPCSKIYKTDLIKNNDIKFEESLKYEDTLFVVKAIYNAQKSIKLNRFLHYYMIHEKSETTVRDERVFDILKIVDKIRKYLKNDKSIK
ncbi:MAG: glycosyltransferase family 2 protein, partial [Bacilli bacterium]|nr:glycosyltransferase family 2 protein [Bacilli bacterium]